MAQAGPRRLDSGLTNPTVYALVVSLNGVNETNIFVGTRQGGIFLSSDNGTSWTAINNGLSGLLVSSLVACPTGTGPIGTSGSDIFAYSVYNAIISVLLFQRTMVRTGLKQITAWETFMLIHLLYPPAKQTP